MWFRKGQSKALKNDSVSVILSSYLCNQTNNKIMRKQLLFSFSAALITGFVLCSNQAVVAQTNGGAATIAITEVMFNPPEAGVDTLEYLEIYNYGSTDVDLTGFYFTGVQYVVPSGLPAIAPGTYGLLSINAEALSNTLGVQSLEWTAEALTNNGEGLSLRDANGTLVDTVRYDDLVSWPAAANGGGASLERCDPTSDGTLLESWIASTTGTGVIVNGIEVFGTPGAANSECITVGIDDQIITTISAYPNPSATGEFRLTEKVSGLVYDVVGQVVTTITNSNSIDLTKQSVGHYLLRTDNGQVIRLMK